MKNMTSSRKSQLIRRILPVTALASLGTMSLLLTAQAKLPEWKAPAAACAVANPVPSTAASLEAGKKYYVKQCNACHGAKGKGDGPDAADLERKPGDLSSARVKAMSDGEIFWKMSTGRLPMPAQEKILTPEQRWQVINYVRTLQK